MISAFTELMTEQSETQANPAQHATTIEAVMDPFPQHIAHDGRVAAASAISVLFAAIAGSPWWASDDAADLRRGRFAPQGFIEPQAAGRMYLDSTAHEVKNIFPLATCAFSAGAGVAEASELP